MNALVPATASSYSAHDLMREVLHLAGQRYTEPDRIARIATAAGFVSSGARIYFLTQLRERVRMMPIKLFVTPEAREKLLEAMQSALDQEIAREEVT